MGAITSLLETIVLTVANVFAAGAANQVCNAGIPLITNQFPDITCVDCDIDFTGVDLPLTFTGVKGETTCTKSQTGVGDMSGFLSLEATGSFGLSNVADLQTAFGEGDITFGFEGAFEADGGDAFTCKIFASIEGFSSGSLGTVTLDTVNSSCDSSCVLADEFNSIDQTVSIDCSGAGGSAYSCSLALECTDDDA